MKFRYIRKLVPVLLSACVLGTGHLPICAETESPSEQSSSQPMTPEAGHVLYTYEALEESNQQTQEGRQKSGSGLSVRKMWMADQDGHSVPVGPVQYTSQPAGTDPEEQSPGEEDESNQDTGSQKSDLVIVPKNYLTDYQAMSDLTAPGEATAMKHAAFENADDMLQGIARIDIEALGRKSRNEDNPINVLFIMDRSVSMNSSLNAASVISPGNMHCINPEHYYLIPEEAFGPNLPSIPCVVNLNDYNPEGAAFNSWKEGEKSPAWVNAMIQDIIEQTEGSTYSLLSEDPASEEDRQNLETEDTSDTGTLFNLRQFAAQAGDTASDVLDRQDVQSSTEPETSALSMTTQRTATPQVMSVKVEDSFGDLVDAPVIQPDELPADLYAMEESKIVKAEGSLWKDLPLWNQHGIITEDGEFEIFTSGVNNASDINTASQRGITAEGKPVIGYTMTDHDCMDRNTLSTEYVTAFINELFQVNPGSQVAIRDFADVSTSQAQIAFCGEEQQAELISFLNFPYGASLTNYEAAFQESLNFLDGQGISPSASYKESESDENEYENRNPTFVIFVTDGEPTAHTTPRDLLEIQQNFQTVHHELGADAADRLKTKYGTLFTMSLNMQVTPYMQKLASESRMALECMNMSDMETHLTAIRDEIAEGYPTSCTIRDTIGKDFELLIDGAHPLRIGRKQSMEEVEEYQDLSALPDYLKVEQSEAAEGKDPLTTVSASYSRFDDNPENRQFLSFYIKGKENVLSQAVSHHSFKTNTSAKIRYLSGSIHAGQDGDGLNEDTSRVFSRKSALSPEASRIVYRDIETPTVEADKSMVIAHKSVSVQTKTVHDGEELVYTVTLKNRGTADIEKMLVWDGLSEHLELPENISRQDRALNWTLENLEAGSTRTIQFKTKVAVNQDVETEVENEYPIPNTAYFYPMNTYTEPNQSLDPKEKGETNKVDLVAKLNDEQKDPEEWPEDPVMPDDPLQTAERPVSGSKAPEQVSQNIVPQGTASTTQPVQTAVPQSSTAERSTVYTTPSAAKTGTSWLAATPVATAVGRHPVFYGILFALAGLTGLFLMISRKGKPRPKNIPRI